MEEHTVSLLDTNSSLSGRKMCLESLYLVFPLDQEIKLKETGFFFVVFKKVYGLYIDMALNSC